MCSADNSTRFVLRRTVCDDCSEKNTLLDDEDDVVVVLPTRSAGCSADNTLILRVDLDEDVEVLKRTVKR